MIAAMRKLEASDVYNMSFPNCSTQTVTKFNRNTQNKCLTYTKLKANKIYNVKNLLIIDALIGWFFHNKLESRKEKKTLNGHSGSESESPILSYQVMILVSISTKCIVNMHISNFEKSITINKKSHGIYISFSHRKMIEKSMKMISILTTSGSTNSSAYRPNNVKDSNSKTNWANCHVMV